MGPEMLQCCADRGQLVGNPQWAWPSIVCPRALEA